MVVFEYQWYGSAGVIKNFLGRLYMYIAGIINGSTFISSHMEHQ